MKYLILIVGLCCLIAINILQNRKINMLTKEHSSLKDTLNQYIIQQFSSSDRYSAFYSQYPEVLDEPKYPQINDSIFEIHWITISFGLKVNFIKLECMLDSTFKLTYKYARIKNVLNGEGVNELIKTNIRYIDKSVWQEFKTKLNNINFFEQNKRDKITGISFPADISWQFVNSSPYIYIYGSTNNNSPFFDACEVIFNQLDHIEQ